MSYFKCFTHLPIGALRLQGIAKPPWSLLFNLCLKFTAQLRDLTVCVGYRDEVPKIMLNTIHSTFLLMNLACINTTCNNFNDFTELQFI